MNANSNNNVSSVATIARKKAHFDHLMLALTGSVAIVTLIISLSNPANNTNTQSANAPSAKATPYVTVASLMSSHSPEEAKGTENIGAAKQMPLTSKANK